MADNAYPMPGQVSMTTLAEWESYFSALSGAGIVTGLAPGLNAQARTATVQVGAALLRGIYKPVTVATSAPIPAAATQNRVDRLVLRLNRDAITPAEFVTFVVIPGSPAANPTPPTIRQDPAGQGVWDLPIARWISQATGGLASLVDERAFLGVAPILYSSQVRPTPPQPVLGIETDTGNVTRWDGNAWKSIAEDTGWVNLAINGPEHGAWTANALNRARKRNGIVHLRFAVRRWDENELSIGDPNGSAPILLPAMFRPPWDEPGSGWHSRSPVGVTVEAKGPLRIYPLTASIPAGRTVMGSATYMVD